MAIIQNKLRTIFSAIFSLLGIASAGFGIKAFLQPAGFIDGGVTGISMLLAEITGYSLSLFLLLLNLPFIYFGYRYIGRGFALRSILAMLGLAAFVFFVECPAVTHDKLLTAVFGGIFLGAGIGLSIRGRGVIDGTEVLALMASRNGFFTVGDIVLGLNVLIFSSAAAFLGIESALYSVLTYYSASKTIDFLLHGIEEYFGLLIVSREAPAIRAMLTADLRRGVTRFNGRGGMEDVEYDILFCVVTRIELPKIQSSVQAIDPNAFMVVNHVSDVRGGLVKPGVLAKLIEERAV